MSKDKFYVQCRLNKPSPEGGTSYRTAWIPEKFAQEGRILKLKIGEDWSDGWKVIDTWGRKSSKEMSERSRYHLTQRDASDI